MVEHVRELGRSRADGVTALDCWGRADTGRRLIHAVADELVGVDAHNPIDRFGDELIISFLNGLTKNRKDRDVQNLHVTGVLAAMKAARSKRLIMKRSAPAVIGV